MKRKENWKRRELPPVLEDPRADYNDTWSQYVDFIITLADIKFMRNEELRKSIGPASVKVDYSDNTHKSQPHQIWKDSRGKIEALTFIEKGYNCLFIERII